MIRKIYQSIINIGIDADTSRADVKKIKILNGISFFTGIIFFVLGIFIFFLSYPYEHPYMDLLSDYFFSTASLNFNESNSLKLIIPLFDFILSIICFLSLFLNFKKIKYLSVLLISSVATFSSIFFYSVTGIQAIFFIFISGVLPLVLFDNKILYMLFSFINFIAFTLITLILYKNGNFTITTYGIINPPIPLLFNLGLAFLLLIFIINHFKKESLISEELLQKSNNILEMQSREIQFQISLARKIQMQLLPKTEPYKNIYSLYKSMNDVGGDFYDYIYFRNSDKIGIFISDVSGHGVPAALITSMLKSTILQAGERKENPAELLHYINDVLQNQTADNFITAFYCIYNSADRSIIYSNAGHPQPYIITGTGITLLQKGKNTALAMFPNNLLAESNKSYENFTGILPAEAKLLLYTDGLIEARPADGRDIFFEESSMTDILNENYNLPCNLFIDTLYNKLVEFRGSDSFEDDVCLICLDV